MVTHPKTGHDHAVKKPPEWPLPNLELNIRIARDHDCDLNPLRSSACSRGTRTCNVKHDDSVNGPIWIAEVSGVIVVDGKEESWNCMTHGETIVHAAEMAADLLRIHYETCKNPDVDHCYCLDVTWSSFWHCDEGSVTRAKKCCLCLQETRVEEFEP